MGDTCYPVEIVETTFKCYLDQLRPVRIRIEFLKNQEPMESQESDPQLVDISVTIDGKTENASKVEHETLRVNPKPTDSSGGSEQMFSGREDGKTLAV